MTEITTNTEPTERPCDLTDVPFAECYHRCGVVRVLGVGECENIEECSKKFEKTHRKPNLPPSKHEEALTDLLNFAMSIGKMIGLIKAMKRVRVRDPSIPASFIEAEEREVERKEEELKEKSRQFLNSLAH